MNSTIKRTTTVFGILLAFAGFEHGLFETLQGFMPTESNFIQAIGADIRWWVHGSEDAFTLITNFLLTGICAMCVGLFIIYWSICCLSKKNAPTVFVLSFVLLVLVGGGIGFIPFFLTAWAYSTRINKPLITWNKCLGPNIRIKIAPLWPYAVILATICWLIALEIAVFGYYPINLSPDELLITCWKFLLFAFIFINISYIAAIARDINSR